MIRLPRTGLVAGVLGLGTWLYPGSERAVDDLRQRLSDSHGASVEAASGLHTAFARVVQTCAAWHRKFGN